MRKELKEENGGGQGGREEEEEEENRRILLLFYYLFCNGLNYGSFLCTCNILQAVVA